MSNKAPSRPAYVGSGRAIEGGALAARKQDLNAHASGRAFRHNADHVDMSPQLSGVLADSDVQGTLEKMADLINTAGQGYITIGDGYDEGDYNVGDPSTPSLHSAFIAAFANTRLQNGGVVLVKAGTYRLENKVSVPTGITIMGEPMGTIIISAITNNQAMFEVDEMPAQYNLGYDDTSPITSDLSAQFNRFYNITLADNLDGYVKVGGNRIPTLDGGVTRVPFISCKLGSYTVVERVSFIGLSTVGNPRVVSNRAIATNVTTPSSKPTTLIVENCYADGVMSAIEFKPTTGARNHLRVINNRFRFTGISTGIVRDDWSCISMNMCNAHFEGNYMMGMVGTGADQFLGITAIYVTSNAVSDSDVIINRIGNSGGIDVISGAAYQLSEVRGFFWAAATPATIRGADIANTWGYGTNNSWSITIGDGNISTGDLTGPAALDTALLLVENNAPSTATATFSVLINSGTYELTRGGTSDQRARLIGAVTGTNSNSETMPVINVDIATGGYTVFTHPAAFVGWELRNLRFQIDAASEFQYIGTAPDDADTDDVAVVVDNCIFEDVGLQIQRIDSSSSTSARTTRKTLNINNCHFYQTGTFNDELSLHIPTGPDIIHVLDSTFNNYGYPLYIGDSVGYIYSKPPNGQVLLDNCIFTMFNEADAVIVPPSPRVRQAPLLGAIWVAIVPDNERYSTTVRNCKFDGVALNDSATTTSEDYTTIAADILATGDVTNLVEIHGRDIRIEACEINGPLQKFTTGGNAYPLPALNVRPGDGLHIDNCSIRGALALQLEGSSFANAIGAVDKWRSGAVCTISNSLFGAYDGLSDVGSGGTPISYTCIDFDLPNIVAANIKVRPRVSVNNCVINNAAVPHASTTKPRHTVNTGAAYNAAGVVQFYGQEWDFDFSNNTVLGYLPSADVGFDTYAVVVDTYEGATTYTKAVIVSDNQIFVECESAAGGWIYGALKVLATGTSITGNCFSYITSAAIAATIKVYITVGLSGVLLPGTFSSGIISGNNFLRGGDMYTGIVATGGVGLITGNTFELPGPTSSVDDWFIGVNYDNWEVNNNKNQSVSTLVRPWEGFVRDIVGGDLVLWNTVGSFPYANFVNMSMDFQDNNDNTILAPLKGVVNGTGAAAVVLIIPLYKLLPFGAKIVSLDSLVSKVNNITWTGAGTIDVDLYSSGSVSDTLLAATSSHNVQTDLSVIHTLAPSVTDVHRNRVYLRVSISLGTAAAPRQFSLSSAYITYRW